MLKAEIGEAKIGERNKNGSQRVRDAGVQQVTMRRLRTFFLNIRGNRIEHSLNRFFETFA